MTPLSFLYCVIVTILVLLLIRLFWKQLLIIGTILYYTGTLVVIAFTSAILWAIFVAGSSKGWGWTFLYFFLTYSGIAIVGGLIISDAFNIILNTITKFFKKIK
jgi:hypothetical protein